VQPAGKACRFTRVSRALVYPNGVARVLGMGTDTRAKQTDIVYVAMVRNLVKNGTAHNLRRSAQLSIREEAEAVGVAPSTVLRWETGLSVPRSAAAHRLGVFLEQLGAVFTGNK
jgi:DNA-binding transcriptional regulator YiaG